MLKAIKVFFVFGLSTKEEIAALRQMRELVAAPPRTGSSDNSLYGTTTDDGSIGARGSLYFRFRAVVLWSGAASDKYDHFYVIVDDNH